MENDPPNDDDLYDCCRFEIDPETESAVDPDAAPLHTIYHKPLGGFIMPPPLLDNLLHFNRHFPENDGSNPKHGPRADNLIPLDVHHAQIPILVAPIFGKGTGLEEIKEAREVMLIDPTCSFSALKEQFCHTFFENKHYRDGGNLGSGKIAVMSKARVEVKEISVQGLGSTMVAHEGNLEAVLMMVGRRAPEMFLN
ncbi:hypothetical protein MMC11_006450, partial [Xylographa trunciseda]|nr:hypothetical protein [Xylographa trunciseda]